MQILWVKQMGVTKEIIISLKEKREIKCQKSIQSKNGPLWNKYMERYVSQEYVCKISIQLSK